MDIMKYEEGPKEIVKYMDYLPEDDETRMNFLISFMHKVTMS